MVSLQWNQETGPPPGILGQDWAVVTRGGVLLSEVLPQGATQQEADTVGRF